MCRNKSFKYVNERHNYPAFPPQNPERIGRSGIPTSVLPDIDAIEQFSNPNGGGD